MVGRVATAWVLMATLLLCPFACLGQAVATFTATEVGVRGDGYMLRPVWFTDG